MKKIFLLSMLVSSAAPAATMMEQSCFVECVREIERLAMTITAR